MVPVLPSLRRLAAAVAAIGLTLALSGCLTGKDVSIPKPAAGVDPKCLSSLPPGYKYVTLHVESYQQQAKRAKITIKAVSDTQGLLKTGPLPDKDITDLPWCGMFGFAPKVKLTITVIATLPDPDEGEVQDLLHCSIRNASGQKVHYLGSGTGLVMCQFDTLNA